MNKKVKLNTIVSIKRVFKHVLKSVVLFFGGSKTYWRIRYLAGGDSGWGSEGIRALEKAKYINGFISENINEIHTIVEWGVGDGKQLSLYDFRDKEFVGIDVSKKIIIKLQKKFQGSNMSFYSLDRFQNHVKFDLALSIEVIFHLTEDSIFNEYMDNLFFSSKKYVLIFSTNYDSQTDYHIRNHEVVNYSINRFKDFEFLSSEFIPSFGENKDSSATFYLFRKRTDWIDNI